MHVLCLFIIQDIILDHVVSNYIADTPFLKIKKIKIEDLECSEMISFCDIVIIEPNFAEHEFFYPLKKIISTKPTLFISDNKNLIKIYGHENAVYLKKTVCYNEFIDGISLLIDNFNMKSVRSTHS